jgi:luciferase family oxidoreductase group 1
LSVLDQSPVRSGSTPADAIQETLRLAEAAERLGYYRYWMAEHHSSGALGCASPEILVGQIAARTSRIRVGSGGVLLSHYSALKVAENFRMLEALYPGRIDLGIGRAPGGGERASIALAEGPGALGVEYFPRRVADLIRFLHDRLEPDHPFAGVHAMPLGPTAPEVWLLGSTAGSATYAAHFGTAFSFANFINPEGGAAVVRAYAEHFRPSPDRPAPRASVAVFVVCADTEAEARRLAQSRLYWIVRSHSGHRGPYPSVAEAEAHLYTPQELAVAEYNRGRTIFGAPEQVRDHLLAMAEDYGVEEFVVLTITEDYATRLHSYELLAQVFELDRPG